MSNYRGDIRLGDTIDLKFTARAFATGIPTTLAGSPVISAYLGNNVTQLTAGITLSVDFDGVTGLNNVRVVATSGNGYATATNYDLVITTGTVGGVSVVGEVVGCFSIESRSAVMPTTGGRTLDVSAGGEAGLDWANVGSPTTTVGLTNTTVGIVTLLNSLAAGVVTATAIATGAITNAKFAASAIDATAIAANALAAAKFASGAFDAVWTVTDRQLTAFSTALALSIWHVLEASIVTASTIGLKVKTNLDAAITTRSSHAAADIWAVATRLLTAGTNIVLAKGTGVTGFNDLDATGIENATWNAVRASHTTAGTFGQGAASVQGNVTGSVGSVTAGVTVTTNNDKTGYALSTAGVQAIWDALTSVLTTASSIGKLLVDNLNATIASRSSHAAADIWTVATRLLTAGTNIVLAKGTGVTGFNDLSAAQVNTEVDTAIADARLDELLAADSDIDGAAPPTVGSVFHELLSKTTGSFTFDQTTDALEAIRDNQAGADPQTLVDAILDELLSAHTVSGSVGAGISAASSAGDPWATNLPGAYSAGTAGEIIGHVVRASVRGTSDSGSTTTMVDAARTEADPDYWKGCLIEFTSGAVLGQTRLITGFTPASDTITFAPATTQAISTQTYKIIPAARVDLQLWLGTVVNALIAGRVDTNVQAMANDVVTAAVIANAAIDAATFAAGAIDANAIATDAITNVELATSAVTEIQAAIAAGSIASVTGNVGGNVVGSVGSMAANGISAASLATGAITNAKFAAGAIDASALAADAIDASALAADALTEIENSVWNAVRASHTTAGSFGQGAASVQGNVTGSVASVTNDVGITQAGADKVWGSATRTLTAFSTALALSVWDVLTAAIATASSIGLQLKTNVDAAISTRSTYAGADTAGTTTLLSRIVGTLLTGNHSPQSGDSFARLGATGSGLTSLASQTSVDDLPTNSELATALAGADDAVLAAIATVQADTDNLQTRLPAALSSGRMPSEAQVVSDKTGYALSTGGNNAVRDAISDDIIETQGNYTVQQALSIILAAVAGRTDTGGLVFRTPNGTTVRITATVNGSNERTGITLAPSS